MTVWEKLVAARKIEKGTVQRKPSSVSTSPVLAPLMAQQAAKSPTMLLAAKAATQTTRKSATAKESAAKQASSASTYLTGSTTTTATPYAAGLQTELVKPTQTKSKETPAKQTTQKPATTKESASKGQAGSSEIALNPVKVVMAQQAAKSPTTQLARSFVTGQTSSQATIYNRGPTKELARGLELQRLGRLDISAAQRELNDMETTQRKKLEDAVKREIKAQEAITPYDFPDSQDWQADYNMAIEAAGERIGAAQAELDALDKAIAKKRSDIQTAKQMRWASVSSQPDFEVYAAKGAALPASVNPTKGAKENHDVLKAIETGRKLGLRNWTAPSAMYGEMTDEETRVYNYLLAKDQERGTSEAQEYWQYMVNVLKDRRGRAQADEVENFGLLRPVSTAAYGLAAGFDRGISGIAQNFSDTPLPPSEIQYGAGYVRSDLEGVGPEIFGNSLGQVGFDLANTVGNMVPSVAVGTAFGPEAALATTFLSAGGNAYGEALSQGYGQKEARAYGILNGASEAGLQYVLGGISSLGGKVVNSEVIQASLDNIQHAVLRIPAKYVVAAAGEMTEEYLQEILNPVFRNLALGEDNEFKLVTEEAAYAALLAALSVGVMEGPNIVSSDKAGHGGNPPIAPNGVEGTKKATDGVAVHTGQNTRLTNADIDEYLTVGKNKSIRDAKSAAVERGETVILSTPGETQDFIGDAIRGVAGQTTKAYGKVGTEMAGEIQAVSGSDIDVTGWYLELVPDDLRHSFDQHKEAKREGNINLTEQDFLNIPDYIDSYDDILEFRTFKNGDREVVLGKKINGYSVIVELVSGKRKSLHFKNMWGLDTQTYESRYGKSTASHPDRSSVSANDPTEVYHGTSSVDSIPQTTKDVNIETGKDMAAPASQPVDPLIADIRAKGAGQTVSQPVDPLIADIRSRGAGQTVTQPIDPLIADIRAKGQRQALPRPQHKAQQENILTQEGKPDTITSSDDDIQIGRSLGAAAFRDPVRLPDGRTAHITEGSKIIKVVTFAGGGTGKSLRVAQGLAKRYNVDAARWMHRRGDGFVDVDGISEHVELHWFEHPDVGRIKMKVKRYFKDES